MDYFPQAQKVQTIGGGRADPSHRHHCHIELSFDKKIACGHGRTEEAELKITTGVPSLDQLSFLQHLLQGTWQALSIRSFLVREPLSQVAGQAIFFFLVLFCPSVAVPVAVWFVSIVNALPAVERK